MYSLSALGAMKSTEPMVMSRDVSKAFLSTEPTSPPRSSRLCATSAAAHSTAPRRDERSHPRCASSRSIWERMPRHRARSPGGPSLPHALVRGRRHDVDLRAGDVVVRLTAAQQLDHRDVRLEVMASVARPAPTGLGMDVALVVKGLSGLDPEPILRSFD